MATKYYRAKTNVNLPTKDGAMEMLPAGALVAPGNAAVKGKPKEFLAEHFDEVTPGGGAEKGFGPWDVETASAAPGEKRGGTTTQSRQAAKTDKSEPAPKAAEKKK